MFFFAICRLALAGFDPEENLTVNEVHKGDVMLSVMRLTVRENGSKEQHLWNSTPQLFIHPLKWLRYSASD